MRLLRLTFYRRSHASIIQTSRKSSCKVLKTSALFPGSALAFDETLAPGYGSNLLPLRLPLLYSQATLFSVRLKQEVLFGFAGRTHSPSRLPFFVFRVRVGTFW